MNEIVNKFLSARDKFVFEMHVKQPALLEKSGFIDIASEAFKKTKKK